MTLLPSHWANSYQKFQFVANNTSHKLGRQTEDKKSDMPPKIASIPAGGGAPEKEVFKLPHSGTTFETDVLQSKDFSQSWGLWLVNRSGSIRFG